MTVNVPVVLPEAMLTDFGTLAAELAENRSTVWPPAGAGLESVTVPVEDVRPMRLAGFKAIERTVGALSVRVAFWVVEPNFAEMPTRICDWTPRVVMLKLAELWPAGTVTTAGTLAAEGLLLERLICMPPVGAIELSVTVPVDGLPPATVVGLRLREDSDAGVMVRFAEAVPAPMLATTCDETASVLTVKLTEVLPEETVTELGTEALGLLEDRLTTTPLGPA